MSSNGDPGEIVSPGDAGGVISPRDTGASIPRAGTKSSGLATDSADANTIPVESIEKHVPSKKTFTQFISTNIQVLGELAALLVFSLVLRLAFNFNLSHVNNFASCDAFEYINNGQALLQIFAQPLAFWQKGFACLSGAGSATDWVQVKTALEPLKDFYISGPVFPAFLALVVALSGGTVGNVHYLWPQLLVGNCFVSALTCVLIALITAEGFDKKSARIAGIAAALYPGFIVNSGRLYSETFATFLLVALSYITVLGFRSGGNSLVMTFFSGFLASALQLTRSVMAVLTLALLPITAMQQKGKRRFLFLLPFALGFMMVAAPWLGFQKLAFGGGGLVVDRVGHYNFFIGNNVDTQGWLSYPYPDGRNVDARTFPQLIQQAVKKSPARWVRLMLDKPLRLFLFPWNDFRTEIGVWNFKWQVIYHELILMLAVIGFGLSLFLSATKAPSKAQLCTRIYLAGLFAFHFIYCLFITVPRYNLTAMPELIIFAAAAVSTALGIAIDSRGKKSAAMIAATAALLFIVLNTKMMPLAVGVGLSASFAWIAQAAIRVVLLAACLSAVISGIRMLHGFKRCAITLSSVIALIALPLFVMPLRASGRLGEWYQDLTASKETLHQVVKLPISVIQRNPAGLFLLIDTAGVRQRADGFKVSLNGWELPGPIMPSMSFAENFDRFLELSPHSVQREGERMWDSLTNSAGCGNLDLRQWSMIPLPPSVLSGAAEVADKIKSPIVFLDVALKNSSASAFRIYGSYDQNEHERIVPSLDVYSWEKVFYGVENQDWLSDTRYDIKVPSATLMSRRRDLSDEPGLQNGVYNMAILSTPGATHGVAPTIPAAKTATVVTLGRRLTSVEPAVVTSAVVASGMQLISTNKINDVTVSTTNGTNIRVDLAKVPQGIDGSLWVMRLLGKSRVVSGNACPAAEIDTAYSGEKSYLYKSAWTPRRLSGAKGYTDFEFVVPVKPIVEGNKASAAIVNLKLTSPGSAYLNIQPPFNGTVEFSGMKLEIYSLQGNPIGPGHQVF